MKILLKIFPIYNCFLNSGAYQSKYLTSTFHGNTTVLFDVLNFRSMSILANVISDCSDVTDR